MKYLAVFLFVYAAFAAPTVDEEVIGEENAQSAQFMPPMGGMMNPMMMDPMYGMMNYPGMMNMGYPQMGGYPGMNMGYPGMGGPMYYSSKRDDYPIDYSQGCSSSCGCAQRCQVMFWMPCNCMCPPPCPPPPPPPCSCMPCMGWMCPPKCCTCGGCDTPPQDPDIPEFPFPRPEDEKEKEDPIRFPILNGLRNRLEEEGILKREEYPADIIIRWRDN